MLKPNFKVKKKSYGIDLSNRVNLNLNTIITILKKKW